MRFLAVRTPRKTVRHVSHKIGGHKRTTGEAGITTTARGLFVISEAFYEQLEITVDTSEGCLSL